MTTYLKLLISTIATLARQAVGSETWARLYEILAEVEGGARPAPSGYADIESDLPTLEWPA